MKLPNKIAHYLRGNVDFDSFFVLDIAMQDKNNAVLLLAPRDIIADKFFCMQYRGRSYYYNSVENMVEACVECRYFSRTTAKRLTRKYYKSAGNASVKHTR